MQPLLQHAKENEIDLPGYQCAGSVVLGGDLSDAVEELLSSEAVEPAISQLVEVEFVSALSRRVRMGEVTQEEARVIVQQFQAALEAGFYTQLALEPIHYTMARDWIHQFNTPLRTLDGLHLAIAVAHNIPLVTADEGLAESAEALGAEVQILKPLEEA